MIITTTDTIAGQRITVTCGQVFGLAVRTRGLGGNIVAGLANLPALNGDDMTQYIASLVEARDGALARMAARATALGANAVIHLQFDTAPIGYDMSEIVAYGTAVITEPIP